MLATSPTALRRIVRQLIRRAPAFDHAELAARAIPWRAQAEGGWSLGLVALTGMGALVGPDVDMGVHWVFAARPVDERAMWQDIPPLLRTLGVPEGALPLVAPDRTPAGEAIYWLWQPADAQVRHAPNRKGTACDARLRAHLVERFEDVYTRAPALAEVEPVPEESLVPQRERLPAFTWDVPDNAPLVTDPEPKAYPAQRGAHRRGGMGLLAVLLLAATAFDPGPPER